MILAKTDSGHQVMKDRSVPLSPRQRAAFILIDGHRALADVLRATHGATLADIEQLVTLGLVEELESAEPEVPVARVDVRTPQQRYTDAYRVATSLTAELGLRGFRLNLAIEGAGSYEELLALAPKIREAVGPKKFASLEQALGA